VYDKHLDHTHQDHIIGPGRVPFTSRVIRGPKQAGRRACSKITTTEEATRMLLSLGGDYARLSSHMCEE
jgi:hypothetical protein